MRRTLTLTATISALMSLALPAQAGDASGGIGIVTTVTAQECIDGGGMAMGGTCVGGTQDGATVSG